MIKILKYLLSREQEKFIKSVEIKIPKINTIIPDCHILYTDTEQLHRLFGMMLTSDSTLFTDIVKAIPVEYHEEYLEAIDAQLPQHPFIRAKEKGDGIIYDFAGAAFRDFVIAYCLASETLSDFVSDYLDYNKKYCPSQMLIEFYSVFAKNKISGKHIPIMYNSFKSIAQLGDKVAFFVNGDSDDCSIEFNLMRKEKVLSLMEFKITDLENGIWVNQLSNCYIDIDGKVSIGNLSSEARVNNSLISCNEIILCSENISIEAYSPGECILIADKISYHTSTMPRFEIKTDNKKNLKVSSQTLKDYFKLLAYKCDNIFDSSDNEFDFFANVIRRIFSCLRSHSKDTPARKMDFIDNRIIGVNEDKKNVLNFLLEKHILYTDEQDWLYKLDTNKLPLYSIKWHNIKEGNSESLKGLYNQYITTINQK